MTKQLPQELQPAYERSIDRASIDARMAAQIEFEDKSGAPRNFDAMPDAKPNRGNGLLKKAGVATLAGTVAAGSMLAIGRAVDYEQSRFEPPKPIERPNTNPVPQAPNISRNEDGSLLVSNVNK